MLPTNPHLRTTLLRVAFSLVAFSQFAAQRSQAQDGIPPVPDVDFPFFFDDFHYPVDGVAPDPSTDPFQFPHPDGHLFGHNAWFTADGPDQELVVERSRGWYEYDWLEYRKDGHIWGYHNPPDDRSWFDTAGAYLSGDLDAIMSSNDKLRDLDSGAREFDPNFILFRAEKGRYLEKTASIRISSGLAAQTGTWAARILLPDFDGLRHHAEIDGSAADISFYPAFWLQSSESFIEEREPVYPEPKDRAQDPTRAHGSWSEANYEFNNWFDPDAGDGHKAISTGITWANPYWSTNDQNPRTGVFGREGMCHVQNSAGVAGGRIQTSTRECFNILTGKTHGPMFVILFITITPTGTRYYMMARDEDLYHGRPRNESNDFYDDFDVFRMSTIDEIRQYAPPRLLRMLVDLNLRAVGNQTLPERKDMLIDWVFYTPEVLSASSSPSIWSLPRTVTRIRDHLWTQHNRDHEPIWRINATGLLTGRPTVQKPRQKNNPCLSSNRWPGFGFDVEIQKFTYRNRIFFSPETKISPDQNSHTRSGVFSVKWTAHRWLSDGRREHVETVKNQGYIYELPDLPAERWDIDVEVQQLGLHPDHEACTPEPFRDSYTLEM